MTEPLNALVEQYRQASAVSPPPPIGSDPIASGATSLEQVLRVLGLAANADDPEDDSAAAADHAERDAAAAAAAEAFEAQDRQAATEMAGAGQLPQLASGLAGAAGAAGAALQPFAQLPQQFAQAVQQAAQIGLGLTTGLAGGSAGEFGATEFGAGEFGSTEFGSDDDTALGLDDDLEPDPIDDDTVDLPWPVESGSGAGDLTPAGPPVPAAIAPGVLPGPLPAPSAATAPASAPSPVAVAPHAGTLSPAGGMAGVPMVPPMTGALGADRGGTAASADAKRVTVPAVRNGAPVQGRLTSRLDTPVRPAADRYGSANPGRGGGG